MKIFLQEIKDQEDTELSFTQEDKWAAEAVQRVDEKYDGESELVRTHQAQKQRPIHLRFNLRKVDEVVVINGRVDTTVRLVCSRCANYYNFRSAPGFSALFCKDPVMAGVAHFQLENGENKPAGQNKGYARHAHDESRDDDSTGTQDLDITYISNDYIDLADVLTEQLRLQLPFQPLCREDCKGMCPQCGADLNIGRCACAKLTTTKPFSVLKNLKI